MPTDNPSLTDVAETPPPAMMLLARLMAEAWRILAISIGFGGFALAATFFVKPTFTARTSFLPPQQQQSSAAAALASLSALASIAGGSTSAGRTSGDQYVALLQSTTISNRLIDRFDLLEVYDVKLRVEAQKELSQRVRVAFGRRDGLISLEVDDHSPERSAKIAVAYVEELRTLTSKLALTEAQQRRTFFESQVAQTKARLDEAQKQLQSTGTTAGVLRAEPKAAAEAYARLKAELTGSEIRLQTMRQSLTDLSPEVLQLAARVAAVRAQLRDIEADSPSGTDSGYLGRFRDFKYQEALYELFSRQFELARLDESREPSLIQVIDQATPPEKKTAPKRGVIAMLAAVMGGIGSIVYLLAKPSLFRLHKQMALAVR